MVKEIGDFIADWQSETKFTVRIFTKITEEIKGWRAHDNIRSLERLAWHITQTLTEMPFNAGLLEEDVLEDLPVPQDMSQIVKIYQQHSRKLVEIVQKKWRDADLMKQIEMYGEQWEAGKILSVLVLHQTHHRGQMTALMRLNNIAVPSTYGPTQEVWQQMGMTPLP